MEGFILRNGERQPGYAIGLLMRPVNFNSEHQRVSDNPWPGQQLLIPLTLVIREENYPPATHFLMEETARAEEG